MTWFLRVLLTYVLVMFQSFGIEGRFGTRGWREGLKLVDQ